MPAWHTQLVHEAHKHVLRQVNLWTWSLGSLSSMCCQSICLEAGESVNPWAVNPYAWSRNIQMSSKLANGLAYIDTGHSSMSFIKLTKMYMDKYQSKIRVHVSTKVSFITIVLKISQLTFHTKNNIKIFIIPMICLFFYTCRMAGYRRCFCRF